MTQHHRKHTTLAHAGPGKPATATTVANSVSGNEHYGTLLSDEDIRLRAYLDWEGAGRPAGDGVQFWLEAEQELSGIDKEFVQPDGRHQHPDYERLEAEKAIKAHQVGKGSDYRDNNRMFQSHGDRGHRHDGRD